MLKMTSQCAMSDVWSRWTLPSERSSIVAFAQIGLLASVFFHHAVSNWIAISLNWPCVFYITGILWCTNDFILFVQLIFFTTIPGVGGIIWALLWLLYVKDDPDHDDKLSGEERDKLAKRLNFVALKRSKLVRYFDFFFSNYFKTVRKIGNFLKRIENLRKQNFFLEYLLNLKMKIIQYYVEYLSTPLWVIICIPVWWIKQKKHTYT